jgi:hypothetical protein
LSSQTAFLVQSDKPIVKARMSQAISAATISHSPCPTGMKSASRPRELSLAKRLRPEIRYPA